MAREVPGFAGVFYNEAGELVMYLVDESKAPEAEAAVNDLMARIGRPTSGDEIKLLLAKYDFYQLYQWKSSLNRLLPLAEIEYTDVKESENHVIVARSPLKSISKIRLLR